MIFLKCTSLLLVIYITIVCLDPSLAPSAKAQSGPTPAEEAMIAEFGFESITVEDSAILFYDGEYIEPPYTLTRRGLNVRLNGKSIGWLTSDWPRKPVVDPGDPPHDRHFAESQPVDANGLPSDYWQEKIKALLQLHDMQTATRMYFEALEIASARSGGKWKALSWKADNYFGEVTIETREKKPFSTTLTRYVPWPGEQMLHAANEILSEWEILLSTNGVVWAFDAGELRTPYYRLEPSDPVVLDMFKVLESNADMEDKETVTKELRVVRELSNGSILDSRPLPFSPPQMLLIVQNFRSTPDLKRRLEMATNLDVAVKAGSPPEVYTERLNSAQQRCMDRMTQANSRYEQFLSEVRANRKADSDKVPNVTVSGP